MTKKLHAVGVVAVLLLAGGSFALAQQATPAKTPGTAVKAPEPPAAPAPPVKTGEIRVTIEVPAKMKLGKATIYAKTQVVPGAAEEVPIASVPVGRTAVTVDAAVDEGGSKGVKRYLGVTEVTVQEGSPQPVTVKLVAAPQVDDFCLGCHPNARDPKVKVLPGQIPRDIHVTGKEFPEKNRDKYLAQLKLHNDTVAKLEKENKPHSFPVNLEERVVKLKGGKVAKRYYYTCESCHTLHQQTPWVRYARAPYRDKADLCVACHF